MQYPFPPQQFLNPIFHFEPATYQINFQPLIIANITPNSNKHKNLQPSSPEEEKSFEVLNEKTEEDNLGISSLLSPNSKASSLLSTSKRILKPSATTNQPESPRFSSFGKSTKVLKKRRNPWAPSEDQKLLHFFNIYGAQWAKIAASMGERTGKQVRDRYMSVLIDNINKGPWTEEEDRVILDLYEKIGAQWSRISDHLQGRTEIQVKNRFNIHLKRQYETKVDSEIKLKNNAEDAAGSNRIQIMYWNFDEMLFGKQQNLSPNQ